MIGIAVLGFFIGISPIFLIILILYSQTFLKLIQKYNIQKVNKLKLTRTVFDNPNTPHSNCRTNFVIPSSFDCLIYFNNPSLLPTKAVITTNNKSIILRIEEEEYQILFNDLNTLLIPGIILRYLPNDRLTLCSNKPILPNTNSIQIHFNSGIILEHFYLSLLQQISMYYPSKLIKLNSGIFPNVPTDFEKARRSLQFKEHFTNLLSRLDSLNATESLQWFYGINYLVHRIFFTFYDNNSFLSLIKTIIQNKIEKSSLPSFVEAVNCTEFQMGPSLPIFNDPSIRRLNSPNKTFLEAVIHYLNGFKMKFEIKVHVFFGTITLNAEVKLNSLDSMIRLMFQDLPTNIIWFAFVTEPVVNLDIEIPTFKTQNMPEKIKDKIEGFLMNFIQKEILGSFVLPSMKSFEIPDITGKTMLTAIDNKLEIFKNEMPTAIEDYHRHKKFFKRITEDKKITQPKREFIKCWDTSKPSPFTTK
ncbi:hypothetical protein EHI8A_188630 [Entamoeba histolytica HM-1:IMSS-B]|uniref:SMP-LTD domain-containing protein n=6 Tax=Entamoeba histolytica TaxID=5759 RepID=C4MBK8_ENTH1|nr:hypothetical protein, conserved [Entamoeba histolytica HM-1:IMSS]EMD47474.1 Hypothetical protein EHI5A_220560 [Entamoeba histolytica KU27]EMH75473.1 hypothetical protein EHI8A_188630 [Entamoeba histolytica HM-1:IMSS-B]EMS11197.1 hypothetical protein KM1_265710 [Entamoeba histolytica HM-3:IMSS]ENY62426.1 hypothetical protein EHI7A_165770 [Entamoeba histolytica HM-1:IMSS-A]GAT99411.1 hypothetical protein conserved [Entamoeba histolytica]|eukprot:XP_651184.1 hypothetical protein, conserved [Entamoeba histolytica HM-1:IMSS]